jgi:hypothetical protein
LRQVTSDARVSNPTQVFVDDSGRRGRWARLAGSGVSVLCAAYIGIVVVGLSQTAVGPLIVVPANGNGQVAGFPSPTGVLPGLLATGGTPNSRAAAPAGRFPDGDLQERRAAHDGDRRVASLSSRRFGAGRNPGAAPQPAARVALAEAPVHRHRFAGLDHVGGREGPADVECREHARGEEHQADARFGLGAPGGIRGGRRPPPRRFLHHGGVTCVVVEVCPSTRPPGGSVGCCAPGGCSSSPCSACSSAC